MTGFSDDVLSAYLDGEADDATAKEIDRALENDSALAARLEVMQSNDRLLRDAFAETLAAKPFVPAPSEAKVLPFKPRARPQQRLAPWAVAAAATALLAIVIGGRYFWRPEPATAPFAVAADGTITASPQLAEAVARARGGVPERAGEGTLTVALSFVSASGDPCRQFTLTNPSGETAAIACHHGDAWRVAGLTSRAAENTEFHTAGGPDTALSSIADQLGFREPMDAAAEAHAIRSGWGSVSPKPHVE